MKKLRFRGLAIGKSEFEQKYNLILTDIEWQSIVSKAEREWEEDIDQIRYLAEKYTRNALVNVGYKLELVNGELSYIKSKD